MLSIFLPAPVVAVIAFTVLGASLIAHFLMFIPITILKVLIPIDAVRDFLTETLMRIGAHWVYSYKVLFRLIYPINWDIEVNGELDRHKSYLLISNHQSWLDIPVLFDVFHSRAPFLRFFLKHELIYVPVIGAACWAMEFPFMKRYGQEALAKNPELAVEDLEATRKACERFAKRPATVVNFLEGTRFSEYKRISRDSPYRNLLRPKAGGMSFALNAMGEQLDAVIDVTVAYQPSKHPVFLSFLLGEQVDLRVHVDVLPVPVELMGGDYHGDAEYRERFQLWVNGLWARKDARLDRMFGQPSRQTHTVGHGSR